MRLGFTIQEAYVILLVGLSLIAAGGTFYGQWARKRVANLQQRFRLQRRRKLKQPSKSWAVKTGQTGCTL